MEEFAIVNVSLNWLMTTKNKAQCLSVKHIRGAEEIPIVLKYILTQCSRFCICARRCRQQPVYIDKFTLCLRPWVFSI